MCILKTLALASCLVSISLAPAHAADCASDNLNQSELNQCSGSAFDKADKALNERYQKIVACLKDKAAPLVEAQRAWIRFRDAECKFQGSATEGGSIQPTEIGNCLTAVTEERSKGLDYYLTCGEGDLTCPTVLCDFHNAGQK